MAKIRIYRDETDGEEFPRLCVRCGAETDLLTTQKFNWMPGWVHILIFAGLAPWLIVCLMLRKTMRVTLPVCHQHRNHWLSRKLYIGLGLLGWIAAGILLAVVVDEIPKDARPVAIGVFVFGGLFWLIGGLVYVNSAIKAAEISDRWIELSGVDKLFAAEWRDLVDARSDPAARRPKRAPRRTDDGW